MKKHPEQGAHPRFLWAFLFVLATTNWIAPAIQLQDQSLQWSKPDIMPGINLENNPPILIADQNRTVHAFSSQWINASNDPIRAIVYSQWTLEYGWSLPVDILISPIGEARVTSAYLDKEGVMHLIFYGGNGISGDIYYTKAIAAAADNAKSWSTPVVVGEDAGDPESAILIGDGQDQLSLVYHGKRDGHGVYVTTSNNGGSTWSSPASIFLSESNAPYVFGIQAAVSESGWIHVIWNTFTDAGQGRGIYYSKAKLGESQWSDPYLLVDTADGLGTSTPAIIEYHGVLFALYNISLKIMMRRSMDNGANWDQPAVPFFRHVGINGPLSMVIDNNDQMHLLFGQRISGTPGNPDIHGMWHSYWLDSRWSEPDAVIKGPRVVDVDGPSGFDPYEAHAIVVQGNVLLVTWRTDPGDIKPNGVWYSYALLNAPETPIATLKSPELSVEITLSVGSPTPTITSGSTPQPDFDRGHPNGNRITWVIVGLTVLGFLWIFYALFIRH